MILYPAIDIRGGQAVRLLRGDYAAETTYDPDPVDAARRWVDGGAEILHVVDLDGAKSGEPVNLETIGRITSAVPVPVQVGGGIRNMKTARELLAVGVDRLVVGTAAFKNPNFLAALLREHGAEKVVVGIDSKAGEVLLEGWLEGSGSGSGDAVIDLFGLGARRFLFTPIEVDGTLAGPNLGELERIGKVCAEAGATMIASGGVGNLAHLQALKDANLPAVEGVIVGRALYEECFTVPEAIATLG